MTAVAQLRYKTHARIIKALAHPTRLFILDELSHGERCVRELTEMIGVEMPTVSRHLTVLKNAGILDDEKRGSQVFYRVRVPCVLNVFSCVKAIETERNTKRNVFDSCTGGAKRNRARPKRAFPATLNIQPS